MGVAGEIKNIPPKLTEAILDQAAPVSTTWYVVLDTTKNVRIWNIGYAVQVANETLELRITIDGKVMTDALACTAGSSYGVSLGTSETSTNFNMTASSRQEYRAFLLEGRSVKIEIRKTTALGAGNLQCCVSYGKY